jgi:hypothetical protein
MFILLTIFLLLFISVAMVILYLVRPRFSIQGFLAILAVIAGWVLVLIAWKDIPQTISLLHWQPDIFFPISPTLLIDDISWFFACSLITLALSSVVTSIAHIGQSYLPDLRKGDQIIEVVEVQGQADTRRPITRPLPINENKPNTNWQSWAGILVLTSLGLVAVTAGNMLTLILAWAALDILELFILTGQAQDKQVQDRIILVFSIRMAGIGIVLLAGITLWSQDLSLTFSAIEQTSSKFLLLAAGFRLASVLLHLPSMNKREQKQEFHTILHLVPAAGSLILIVRVAQISIPGTISTFILGLFALIGFIAALNWLNSDDEIKGLPYWLIGTASLVFASAIQNQLQASIAWSIASLLSGGLIFSMFIRHKNFIPLIFLGFIAFSALPFSPTWLGTDLYSEPGLPASPPVMLLLYSVIFLLIHSLLLSGLIRHILRGIFPQEEPLKIHVERWVWFLFPIGMIVILVVHYLIGILLYPELSDVSWVGWIMGAIAVILSWTIWYLQARYFQSHIHSDKTASASFLAKFHLMEWLFRFFGSIFKFVVKFVALLSSILEGDGGILWAFVLFALIFVFLLR